jgi:glycosyltransferase involved in cell wall biosynthesis
MSSIDLGPSLAKRGGRPWLKRLTREPQRGIVVKNERVSLLGPVLVLVERCEVSSSKINPRVSVILASCNGAKFIQAQLDSVLVQLGEEDEVVISDDASTDATLDIVRACGDSRVRLISQPERLGYVRNFERAARAARGAVIFFCDQDDVWLPRKVESSLAALQSAHCVASDAIVVDEHLHVTNNSYFAVRRVWGFSALAILLRPPIVGATMACRRDFLQLLLPFPAHVPHDFWVTFNAALRRKLVVLPEPTILFRRHGSVASLSTAARRRALSAILLERFALLRAMLSAFKWRGGR